MKRIIVGAALVALAFSANANELLVTPAAAKSGAVYSIDFVSDGQAVGFQYNIDLPKGVSPESVNLKSCSVDLPSKYVGDCSVAKGQIIGFVVNDSGEPFPAGLLPVGKVTLSGAKSVSNLRVAKFEVVDKDAKVIDSTVRFSSSEK